MWSPYYLVEDMDDSKLKTELEQCSEGPLKKTDFSIGHRGAGLQFPEHTQESYVAAARMGAGIIECDVTFTADRELVCRHSQCDLHRTTDVLAREDLRWKCTVPPELSATGELLNAGAISCCTSDFTLEEFKSLCGKMDAANRNATTIEEYMDATPSWRTDLYATCGTLLSHAESIELFKDLDVKMTPELKAPSVQMPYEGDYTQEDYAQQMIDEYKAAGVKPNNVYAQSFNLNDVLYWITYEPQFGRQAVFLESRNLTGDPDTWSPTMEELVSWGVNIIAPPMQMLMTLDGNKKNCTLDVR
jgi:glycerophosphoryl diester phosphodiesterase